jgi:hypothetical protein
LSQFTIYNGIKIYYKVIILFDEIDSIAIDRINSNDLREMGRATSSVLKGLDNLNNNIVLIATTNLYKAFDKALSRRFDAIIDFSNYTKQDLIEVGEAILNDMLQKFKYAGRNMRLFKKILESMDVIPYPGELKNLIKTSIAFSDSNNEYDYLKKLYLNVNKDEENMDLINKNAQYLSETINDFRNFIKGDRKIKNYDLSTTINNFLQIKNDKWLLQIL